MRNKHPSAQEPKARDVSSVLLDFIFGEPMPQPEVSEHDDEKAWQAWLDAKAAQDADDAFEDTEHDAGAQFEDTKPDALT